MRKLLWLFLAVPLAAQVSNPGSGTVNSGTAGQLGYYAATGTAISGATSGTTDGAHFAFGIGSVVDNGGVPFPFLGGYFYPGKAVLLVKESNTDPNGEMGINTVLSLTPAAGGDAAYTPTGMSSTVYVDGANLAGLEYIGAVGQVYSNSNTSAPDYLTGTYSQPATLGTAGAYAVIGDYSSPASLSLGTVTYLWGYDADVQNDSSGGHVNNMVGYTEYLSSNPLGGDPNTTDNVNGIDITSPVYGGGSTATNTNGIVIAEQAVSGTTNAHQIYSVGTAPSVFAGRMDFGDLVGAGIMTLAQGTTKITAATGDGWQFSCSDCDTPLTEGATCTASGDHAGAQAIAIRGAIKCF